MPDTLILGSGKETTSASMIGREKQLQDAVYKLLTNHFIALIGESGSGKSTLLKEGILKAFMGELDTDYSIMNYNKDVVWRIVNMRPGHAPFKHLAAALDPMLTVSFKDGKPKLERPSKVLSDEEILKIVEENYGGLVKFFNENRALNENLLIVIDQFEDIFRFRHLMDDYERSRVIDFINNVVQAVSEEESAVYIAISIQSEFLGQTAGIPGFSQSIYEGQYFVPPLKKRDLKEIYKQEIAQTWERGFNLLETAVQHQPQHRIRIDKDLREEFTKLKTREEILNLFESLSDEASQEYSRLMYLSLTALRITANEWLKQFEEQRLTDYLQTREDKGISDFINDCESLAQQYEWLAKTPGLDELRFSNFQEKHFRALYDQWAFRVDTAAIKNSSISDRLEAEWKYVEYDRALKWELKNVTDERTQKWDIHNTSASEVVALSQAILDALYPNGEHQEKDEQVRQSGFSRFQKIIRNSELLWNVLEPDKEEELRNEFKLNLDKIRSRLAELAAMAHQEDKMRLVKVINNRLVELGKQEHWYLKSQEQWYFQAVIKKLTNRDRTGREGRYPVRMSDLWNGGPLPLGNEAGDPFEEFIQQQRQIYIRIVTQVIRQLEMAGIVDIVYIKPHIDRREEDTHLDYNPGDLVDISMDIYLTAAGNLLKDWTQEEAKNSRIYLQLAHFAQDYFAAGADEKYLRKGYELGLNLNWRKEQRPSDGWALRYDPELEEGRTQKFAAGRSKDVVKSQNLKQTLMFLRASEAKYIKDERDKKMKADRRRVWKNITIAVMAVLAGVAVLFAYSASKQRKKADKSQYEMGAVNLLEFLDQSGFIPKDSIFDYKASFTPENLKDRQKVNDLFTYLQEKQIIDTALEASSYSYQAVFSLIEFFLKGNKTAEYNEYYEELYSGLAKLDDPDAITLNPKERHNYIYHALNGRYEATSDVLENDRVLHSHSIFALASNPKVDSMFAFGDNKGETFVCIKNDDNFVPLDTFGNAETSNIIKSLHFQSPYLFVGNDGGTIFIHNYETGDENIEPEITIPGNDLKTRSIDQILSYPAKSPSSDAVYLFIRLKSQMFMTSVNSRTGRKIRTIQTQELDADTDIIGSGIIGDWLILISDNKILVYDLEYIISRFNNASSIQARAKTTFTFSEKNNNSAEISDWAGENSEQLIAISAEASRLYLVRLWEDEQEVKLDTMMFRRQPHSMRIEDLAFHPKKKHLASVSLDGTANIYFNLDRAFEDKARGAPEPGKHADIKVRDNGSPMYYLVYNNDNELITTEDIYIRIWPTDYSSLLRKMED